jgi:microcin C transport system permease protein
MTAYFIRRLLLIVPTFIGITLLVFAITRAVPGGPVERMLSQAAQASAESGFSTNQGGASSALSESQLNELKEYYGFDKPVIQSYLTWLGKVLRLDLGESTRYNEPVWDIIKERFPISIFYGIATLILTYGICIPLGIVKAIKHNTVFDNVSSAIVFVGYAIPAYVIGIALITVFSSYLEWFPLRGLKQMAAN